MKCLVLLFGLLAFVAADSADTYSTENDDFDVDAMVANKEEHKAFIDCFVDNTCNELQADFKKDLPDAIKTACVKCTDAQKHIFKIFLAATKANFPQEYIALKAKYDPEGKHFTTLEQAIANA